MKKLLLCLAAVSIAFSAQAAVQQMRVLAVGIDRRADRAEALAIDYAKKRAVYLTARKLPVEQVTAKVEGFSAADYKEIVRGANVNNIRRVGERTYADVTVSIVDSALRRKLGMAEQSLTGGGEEGQRMRGVLVLPVYVKSNRPYLWEKENKLRDPLDDEVLRQAGGAVLAPAGDLDDLRLVDYANALTVTGKELAPMFTRYGAEEVVVAIYTPPSAGAEPVEESILLRRLTPSSSITERVQIPREAATANNDEARLKQAAMLIGNAVTQIASATAIGEQERLSKATQIPIDFAYANPRELARMQNTLREQREVLLVKLPAISLGAIDGVAYVEGDTKKLREKLVKTGIFVTDSGTGWKLSLR